MKIAAMVFALKKIRSKKEGFTLLELLVFSAIFAVVAVSFVGILISVTRVHVRESSNAEVNRQSQFLIHTIQRNIEESSLIDIDVDPVTGIKTTSTLVLRMQVSADDASNFARTYIYASSGIAYIKTKDNGVPEPLSTGRVKVDSLVFTKRSNPPGHDSVDISLSLSYNTDNIQKKFAQVIKTSVARVSAATFDSNLIPAAANLVIGTTAGEWKSINDVIYFLEEPGGDYQRVGINRADPTYRLDVFAPSGQPDAGALRVIGTSTFSNNVLIGPGTTKFVYTTPDPLCDTPDVGSIFHKIVNGKSYLMLCTWDSVSSNYAWFFLTASSSPSY
ncbi:MAG: Cell wall surface anchor family protein [Parcubacteria group bacterium Gr01-1014_20]|nr:MAG: Cell wall surface anchor family protein [Parcubacteria group bacterium Gr01-1014_20]